MGRLWSLLITDCSGLSRKAIPLPSSKNPLSDDSCFALYYSLILKLAAEPLKMEWPAILSQLRDKISASPGDWRLGHSQSPSAFSSLSLASSPVILSIIDLLYLPTLRREREDYPSLIQSSEYWLSTFCGLGMRGDQNGLMRSSLRKGILRKRLT